MSGKSKLASISRLWGKAKETVAQDGGDFVPVPPGNYTMQFVSFEIGDFGDSRKIMMKWYVHEGPDEEHEGEICTDFDQIDDEDRLVWLQRKLVSMGVDLDEAEIDTEDDLAELLQELVDNHVCCKVRVKEKDGWVNMRVQKHVEFDETIEPSEATSASSEGSESDDDGGEEDWQEGNRVQFESDDGETLVGEIVGFTDDDDAQVKVGRKKHVVSLEDLEAIEDDEEEEGEETEEEESEEAEETDEETDEIVTGDRVYVDEFGEDFVGTVGSIASKTSKSGCFVEFDDGDSGNYAYSDLHFVERPESDDEGEETAEESDDDSDEVEKGDRVVFVHKGKEMRGEVVSVSGADVKVKPDKAKKAVTVDIAEIDFEVADE